MDGRTDRWTGWFQYTPEKKLFCGRGITKKVKRFSYITGNTLGNTTEASAKYSYRILASFSSVVFLTRVDWKQNTEFEIFGQCWWKRGLTLNAHITTTTAFAASVDQNQAAQNVHKDRKHRGKRRNWSLWAISPFPSVFKWLILKTHKYKGLFGKVLSYFTPRKFSK